MSFAEAESGGGAGSVTSLADYLEDTLNVLAEADQYLHRLQAMMTARLRALRFAESADGRARIAEIEDRIQRGDRPPRDRSGFLEERLAAVE